MTTQTTVGTKSFMTCHTFHRRCCMRLLPGCATGSITRRISKTCQISCFMTMPALHVDVRSCMAHLICYISMTLLAGHIIALRGKLIPAMLPAKERDRARQCEYTGCNYRNCQQYYSIGFSFPFFLLCAFKSSKKWIIYFRTSRSLRYSHTSRSRHRL